MTTKFQLTRYAMIALFLSSLFAAPAHSAVLGYMGPGAGLSMFGALGAVICVVMLAILGPVLYPIRSFLAWRRSR